MKEHFYCFQLVGNDASVKRMVASLYLINSKKEEQTLRVCICDDLPHVVEMCDEAQKNDPTSELLQAHLSVSVNYERTLTVIPSEITTMGRLCSISPNKEVTIPQERIWAPGALVILDFKVHMLKPHENASVQISIMSQDDSGNDIPLSVPPRAHLTWQPKNVAGVTKLREAWEEGSSDGSLSPQRRSWAARQGPQPYLSHYATYGYKSVSMPRHMQQPTHSKVEGVVQKKMTKMQEIKEQLKREEQQMKLEEERRRRAEERRPLHSATSSQSSDKKWSGSSTSSFQDSDWNVIRDPRPTLPTVNGAYDNNDKPLPSWAKGLGEDFNYDDVVVV